MSSRPVVLATSVVLALVTAIEVSAARGPLRIQVGDQYDLIGEDWTTFGIVDAESDQSNVIPIDIGFSVDYGGAAPTNLIFINENGYASLGAPVSFDDDPDPLSLATLGNNVIAPYYVDLISETPPAGTTFPAPGSVNYSQGLISQTPLNDHSNDLLAFRAMWSGLLLASDGVTQVTDFQLILLDIDGQDPLTDNGAFRLELNYLDTLSALPVPTLAGYSLGANVDNTNVNDVTAPFVASFGSVVEPPPTGVPEPDAGLLLITGVGLLAIGAMRRRAARQSVR
jgi:hypothetical protein